MPRVQRNTTGDGQADSDGALERVRSDAERRFPEQRPAELQD